MFRVICCVILKYMEHEYNGKNAEYNHIPKPVLYPVQVYKRRFVTTASQTSIKTDEKGNFYQNVFYLNIIESGVLALILLFTRIQDFTFGKQQRNKRCKICQASVIIVVVMCSLKALHFPQYNKNHVFYYFLTILFLLSDDLILSLYKH